MCIHAKCRAVGTSARPRCCSALSNHVFVILHAPPVIWESMERSQRGGWAHRRTDSHKHQQMAQPRARAHSGGRPRPWLGPRTRVRPGVQGPGRRTDEPMSSTSLQSAHRRAHTCRCTLDHACGRDAWGARARARVQKGTQALARARAAASPAHAQVETVTVGWGFLRGRAATRTRPGQVLIGPLPGSSRATRRNRTTGAPPHEQGRNAWPRAHSSLGTTSP